MSGKRTGDVTGKDRPPEIGRETDCRLHKELTLLRHWQTAIAGGYGTNGETYKSGDNKRDIFWSYGGEITGQSAPRLKFMKEIVEHCPFQEMEPDLVHTDGHQVFCLSKGIDAYLFFFKDDLPGKAIWPGPKNGSTTTYEVTV